MKPKLIALYLLDQLLGLLGAGVAMFWSAGRIDWWPGWAVLGVWVAWFGMMDYVIMRFNPGLMEERLSPPKDAKKWDRALMSVVRLVQLARYILAGLDARNGWTTGFPLALQFASIAVCLGSGVWFTWAMRSNRFFSQILRIQSDLGHTVASQGPYRYMRHPGYVGMILFELGLSALLGSWIGLIAGAVAAVLFIVRTALEDRTLWTELPGYADYAQKVRYRLLPGVW